MARRLIGLVCLVTVVTSCAQVRGAFPGETTNGDGINVVVSTVDIPAGAALDAYIQKGKFVAITVPTSAVVPKAVTDISQLQGQYTSAPIYENEQIPLERIWSGM